MEKKDAPHDFVYQKKSPPRDFRCSKKYPPRCVLTGPVSDKFCQLPKIDKFTALQNDVLYSVHFAPTSYRYTGSTKLKDDAVPTIFSFPSTSSHCNNVPVERKPPRKRPLSDTSNQGTVVENKLQKIAPSSPSKEDLRELLKSKDAKLEEQRRKIKVLQQKVRRRDAKIQNLQDLITDLKEKGLL